MIKALLSACGYTPGESEDFIERMAIKEYDGCIARTQAEQEVLIDAKEKSRKNKQKAKTENRKTK
jgi:hypothetical protein